MGTKSAFAIFLSCIIMVGAGFGYSKKEYVEYSNADVLTGDDIEILKEEYQDKITLKLMASCSSTLDSDWSNNKFFKRMNKITGVNFNFDNVFLEGMYKQKKPLAFTSEETMPDVFFKAFFTSQDEITYGANKQILSLNKLIDEYAPNIKAILDENPIIRRCITTPDGNIYALPTMYLNTPNDGIMRGFWWMNKKWLEDVGEVDANGNYKLPSTVEDLYRVLTKFKQEKCTDKNAYPLVICGSTELFSLFPIFGLDFAQYFVQADENDNVVFGPQTDKFYNALQWLNRFFEEGLINKDWNTFTESKRYSYAQNDVYGMYMSASPEYVSGVKRLTQFVSVDPLTSEYHDKAFWSAMNPVERGCFAISSTCQYPELAIKWIDILYNTDNPYWIWAIKGEEGREWEWVDKTKTQWRSTISSAEYSERMKDTIVQPGDGMPYAVDEFFFDKEITNGADYVRAQRNKQMARGQISYPLVYIGQEDLRTFSLLSTNINKHVAEFIASSINSGITQESFSEFKESFAEYRLDEYMSILQDAYNDFYGI